MKATLQDKQKIDVQEVARRLITFYETLENNSNNITPFGKFLLSSILKRGEDLIWKERELIGKLASVRNDLLTSDREIISFTLAVDSILQGKKMEEILTSRKS